MKILISVKDTAETQALAEGGGADIIDVKNPDEGTLGANYPWVIQEIKKIKPEKSELAASIGDLNYKPGGASLAAYGASSLGVEYITAAMYRVTPEEAATMSEAIAKAAGEHGAGTIIAAYADHIRCGSAPPLKLLGAIEEADLFLLDTAIKDGKNILEFTPPSFLETFIEKARKKGFKVAIAGSIRGRQIPIIKKLNPDYLGVRGMVCEGNTVKAELVRKLHEEMGLC